MPHDYEYMTQGVDIYAQRAGEIVCDFFNSLDTTTHEQLKTIKQQYKNYYEFDSLIREINKNIGEYTNAINTATDELNSRFTFFKTTKEELTMKIRALNQRITNLRTNLENINNFKSFIDNLYPKYKEYVKTVMTTSTWKISQHTLNVDKFFSTLVSCERIVHTTAQVVDIPYSTVIHTNTNNKENTNNIPEATRIRNKYLKYKQKYLSLKNKIN
jgi:hypothetical protein